MDINFCKKLPKLELHAHLNGSLSEKTLKELQTPEESIQNFTKLSNFFNNHQQTLEKCFEIFKIAHKATSTPENVIQATENVLQEFHEDGVVYLELRSTPRSEHNMTKQQYVDSVIKGILNHPEICTKLILSLDRSKNQDEALENAQLAMEYRKLYPEIVVGVDVSGDPTKNSWFENILQKIKNESDLKITVHCAEIKNDFEIENILNFHPHRIGHGCCIHPQINGSESLWQKLITKNIFVECCLTSNIITKTISEYKNHHLQYLLTENIPFTLCTDDKGVFNTTLSEEFYIAAITFNLSKLDLWNISYNSINFIFCSEEEKTKLRTILQQWKHNIV